MDTNSYEIWEIITGVMNGSSTPEEKIILDNWLNENPKNKKFFDTLMLNPSKESYTYEDKKRIYLKVQSSIQQNALKKRRLLIYSAVASIAVLVTITIFHFKLRIEPLSPIYQEAYTPFGVKSKIVLADGTVVHLNSGSTLKYPLSFGGKTRDVSLFGEAYFEVTKDPDRPFIVSAGNLKIKVLGTKFNIRNFATDPIIETTLLEGSVAVFKNGTEGFENKNILKPNEMFAYDKNTGVLKKRKMDGALIAGWKDGKCFFLNETFPVIASKLQRSFNVNVKIESPDLKYEVFSGLFDNNRSIYQILDAMKKYRDFDYKIRNDTIVIFKKNL